jgi:hypothetical protein
MAASKLVQLLVPESPKCLAPPPAPVPWWLGDGVLSADDDSPEESLAQLISSLVPRDSVMQELAPETLVRLFMPAYVPLATQPSTQRIRYELKELYPQLLATLRSFLYSVAPAPLQSQKRVALPGHEATDHYVRPVESVVLVDRLLATYSETALGILTQWTTCGLASGEWIVRYSRSEQLILFAPIFGLAFAEATARGISKGSASIPCTSGHLVDTCHFVEGSFEGSIRPICLLSLLQDYVAQMSTRLSSTDPLIVASAFDLALADVTWHRRDLAPLGLRHLLPAETFHMHFQLAENPPVAKALLDQWRLLGQCALRGHAAFFQLSVTGTETGPSVPVSETKSATKAPASSPSSSPKPKKRKLGDSDGDGGECDDAPAPKRRRLPTPTGPCVCMVCASIMGTEDGSQLCADYTAAEKLVRQSFDDVDLPRGWVEERKDHFRWRTSLRGAALTCAGCRHPERSVCAACLQKSAPETKKFLYAFYRRHGQVIQLCCPTVICSQRCMKLARSGRDESKPNVSSNSRDPYHDKPRRNDADCIIPEELAACNITRAALLPPK